MCKVCAPHSNSSTSYSFLLTSFSSERQQDCTFADLTLRLRIRMGGFVKL
jgi:hypothetical protein